MPMDAGTLCKAISEVCPCESAQVGDANDRGTWSFVPSTGATQPQIDAGNNVIQTIPMNPLSPLGPAEFIQRFTDAEYLALRQKIAADVTANNVKLAKEWDTLIALDTMDMNSTNAQTLKADLVADGILTQARADEIFATGGSGGASKWR